MKTIPCTYWGSRTGEKIPELIEATLTITADAFSLHDGLGERKSSIRVPIKDKSLSIIDHIIHRPLSGAELAKRIYVETFISYIINGAGIAFIGVGLLWWRSRDEAFSTLIVPAVIIVLIILIGAVAWGWIVASFRTRKDFLEKTETYIMNQAGQIIAKLQFTPTDFVQLKDALPEIEFKVGSAEPAIGTSSASALQPKGTAQVRVEDCWTCTNCGEEGNSGYRDVCWRCGQEVKKTEGEP
jgi:hypothetical protein